MRRKGFSLVELLVVIATLSVLAGLLLPVLMNGMEQSWRIACLSNLKQMHVGAVLYADSSQGVLPIWTGPDNVYGNLASLANNYCRNYQNAGYHTALYVMSADTGYVPAELFQCPSMDYRIDLSCSSVLSFLHYDYRYNTPYICYRAIDPQPYTPEGMLSRSNRSQTALFSESSNYRSSTTDVFNLYTNTERPYKLRWAHTEGGNAVTHDGAARWLPNCFANKSGNRAGFWPTCGSDTYFADREGPNAALAYP